mmetsp:Transcript_21606/g.45607  ORF Transcript_21606/g.45607 Transcript_21606/m.45607 type:complete len:151 (+) Transcript_21606:755-1207(+)
MGYLKSTAMCTGALLALMLLGYFGARITIWIQRRNHRRRLSAAAGTDDPTVTTVDDRKHNNTAEESNDAEAFPTVVVLSEKNHGEFRNGSKNDGSDGHTDEKKETGDPDGNDATEKTAHCDDDYDDDTAAGDNHQNSGLEHQEVHGEEAV